MPFHVVLFEPEIPPNTGNAIRLCANTGARLHLVQPLGYRLDDKSLKRSGLDYHDLTHVSVHAGFSECLAALGPAPRWFAYSTRATRRYDQVEHRRDDVLVFGPESRGLPQDILARCDPERCLRIPMQAGSRSINLSNAVAVAVYAAWQQLDFR